MSILKYNYIITQLIIVALILIFSSCSGNNGNVIERYESERDNIEIVDKIISLDDRLPSLHSGTNLIFAGDTLLFYDYKSTDLQFTAYNIRENRVLGRFGKFGNGPGEIANYGALFYDENTKNLYGANANQGKIMGFNVPCAILNPEYDAFEKSRIDFTNGNNAFMNPYFINDSTIICSTYVPNEKTRSIVSHIGNLNLLDGTITLMDSVPDGENRRSGIAVSPDKNIIVAADKLQDIIRIFNLDGKLQRIIYGPDYEQKLDGRKRFFLSQIICGDKIVAVYSGECLPNSGKDIIVMDLNGEYIKTLRFDSPINSLAYHEDTDRLYINTDGETQFGYINFSQALNGESDISDRNLNKQAENSDTEKSDCKKDSTANENSTSSKSDKKEGTRSEQKVECIISDPTAAAIANKPTGKSDTEPLTLVDTNTNMLTPVDVLDVGAYKENNGYYLYTIGLFNTTDNDVTIESISLPDSYFDPQWPGLTALKPKMAGFLRLWCKKPITKKNYPIIVKYRDAKFPSQIFYINLHPSGAQLYNEMHR